MARINEPFDVLVVTSPDTLEKDKRIYEAGGALNLTKGKLGLFDKNTGKSIDFTGNTAKGLNDIQFGIGVGDDDFLVTGATHISEVSFVNFQKKTDATELVVTIDPKVAFKADTLYSFTVDFSNDRIYNTLGYNRYRRYFEYTTKKDLATANTNRQGVIDDWVKYINKNSDGLLVATTDGTNGDAKLKLTFKNSPKGVNTAGRVTLLQGWDATATTTENGTPAKASIGTGKSVRELEYQAAGYRGHNYRVSTIWGLANEDIVYQAKEDKNYDLLTIGYVNKVNTSGFRGDVPYTVIIAFEDGTANTNVPATGLYSKLKKIPELKGLITP